MRQKSSNYVPSSHPHVHIHKKQYNYNLNASPLNKSHYAYMRCGFL